MPFTRLRWTLWQKCVRTSEMPIVCGQDQNRYDSDRSCRHLYPPTARGYYRESFVGNSTVDHVRPRAAIKFTRQSSRERQHQKSRPKMSSPDAAGPWNEASNPIWTRSDSFFIPPRRRWETRRRQQRQSARCPPSTTACSLDSKIWWTAFLADFASDNRIDMIVIAHIEEASF